ncbi:MAG TPA: hypothetical protein PLZ93_25735, partial [Nocardioides sp.]|nr:hypothetical protein [Nocardioides sp.]
PSGRNGPSIDETRGPNWRRSSWGLYVPASVERSVEQRILEAACLLPTYGGVTGWAGLYWQGARRWFTGTTGSGLDRPVSLAVGGCDIRSQSGVHVSAERLDPRDLTVVDEVALTSAVRSVCFEMRYASHERQAAIVLSMAAYDDLVSVDELAEYAARHSGWTGIPRCRAAIPLAEENCWSPTEVEMVLTWRLDAELPRPLCNQPVFDRNGRHVGTPDLLDVEAGVVGQYDGAFHLAGAQRAADERAEERYRDLGLECFTMVAADRGDTSRMAARMIAARKRGLWEAESTRQWTVEPPSWWIPTHTVEHRRALDSEQRRRLLRYRAA